MLVDYDADHVKACQYILVREQYEVKALAGCDALEDLMKEVLSFQPDLVLIEHSLPPICGTDAVQMLKGHPITKNLPVIYFTDHPDIVVLATIAGADDSLRKPVEQSELLRMIDYYA